MCMTKSKTLGCILITAIQYVFTWVTGCVQDIYVKPINTHFYFDYMINYLKKSTIVLMISSQSSKNLCESEMCSRADYKKDGLQIFVCIFLLFIF